MNFFPDFAPNSRKEWRLSFFNQICENKLENYRKFPFFRLHWSFARKKNLKSVKVIQHYSILFIRVLRFPGRLARGGRERGGPRRLRRGGPEVGCPRQHGYFRPYKLVASEESVGYLSQPYPSKFENNTLWEKTKKKRKKLQRNTRVTCSFPHMISPQVQLTSLV